MKTAQLIFPALIADTVRILFSFLGSSVYHSKFSELFEIFILCVYLCVSDNRIAYHHSRFSVLTCCLLQKLSSHFVYMYMYVYHFFKQNIVQFGIRKLSQNFFEEICWFVSGSLKNYTRYFRLSFAVLTRCECWIQHCSISCHLKVGKAVYCSGVYHENEATKKLSDAIVRSNELGMPVMCNHVNTIEAIL